VKILADFGNCRFVDERIEDIAVSLVGGIKHAHIKDYRVTGAPLPDKKSYKTRKGSYLTDCEIGIGDVDVAGSIAALEGAGYGGMYSLEFARLSDDGEPQRVIERLLCLDA
jgi:sugar phosphate isomerase/epimerase